MAPRISDPFLAFFISVWVISRAAEDSEEVTAMPGEDVTLHCQGPRYDPIYLIVWRRTDPESDDVWVFDNHPLFTDHQHDRMELRDPEMKDGDASVILKNVNINDAGTYECEILLYGERVQRFIRLKVTDAEKVTAKPGDDVTLHCQGPRYDNSIYLIVWSRTDLESGDYVFYFRHSHSYEHYQNPSFRGRVVLRDPEMKYGDASVILMNVNVNDAGTYECWLRVGHAPELINTIRLTVKSHTAGDKEGGDKEGGDKEENVGLKIGLPVAGGLSVIVVAVVCLLICKCTMNRNRRGRSSNQPVANGEIPMHNLN